MATEKRLIDVLPYVDTLKTTIIKERLRFIGNPAMQAVIDILETAKNLALQQPTVDALEVVHSRFVRIADFGDGEGCFGYCEKCGTVHHAQSPVALKADHRWCRWCGAKMDGDGNG